MFKLTIRNADGSIHAENIFNTMEALDIWLKDAQRQRYWQKDFTTEITDITPVKDPNREAELAAAELRRTTAIAALKALKPGDIKTTKDIEDAILNIVKTFY